MQHPLTPPLRHFGAIALLMLASLFAVKAHAALDSTALTDDHSVNARTTWWEIGRAHV